MSEESALSPAVTAMHVAQVEKVMPGFDEVGPTEQHFVASPDARLPKSVNLTTLRIATQVHQLTLQGVTLKNTFKEMSEVWLSLHTADKACPIVDQMGTKVKYQLVNLYAIKLMKYINSIIGLDLISLGQQNLETRTWRQDTIILNIAGLKITGHEHLFRLMMVNLFGLSEDIIEFALTSKATVLREYVKKTYDYDLGEPASEEEEFPLSKAEAKLYNYVIAPERGYDLN